MVEVSESIKSARTEARLQVSLEFEGKDRRDVVFLLTLANMIKIALKDRPNVIEYLQQLETPEGQREILSLAQEFDQAIDNFNKTAGNKNIDPKFENILGVRIENKLGLDGTIPQLLGEGVIRPHDAVEEFKAGEQTLEAQNTYMSNSEKAEHDEEFLKEIRESGKWSRLHLDAKSPKHFLATMIIDLYPGMLRRTGRYQELDTDELVRALCESLDSKSEFFRLIKEQGRFTKEEFSAEFVDETNEPMEILAPHFSITLRQFTIGDSAHIFNLINRNRNHFSQFGDETADKYKTLRDVENSILNPKNPDRLRFGVWNDKGEFVGTINLTPDKNNSHRGEIGYYLGPEFIGKGNMLNSVLTLSEYAFYHLGYEELYGKIHPDNIASQKVLLKAGFKETGEEEKDKLFTLRKS